MSGGLRRRFAAWAIDDGGSWGTHDAAPSTPPRGIRRLWGPVEPYLGSSVPIVVCLALVSLLAGFAEAAMIYFVVRIAAELAGSAGALELSIGPLSTSTGLTGAFVGAFVALGASAVLSFAAAVLTARLSVRSLNRARKRTLGAFIDAGWELQSKERAGALQELLNTHVTKISQAVLVISDGLIASLGFAALMISALVVQPIAAGTIILGVALVAIALRPISRMTRRQANLQKSLGQDYAVNIAGVVAMAREINVFGVWEQMRSLMERRADRVSRSGFVTRLLLRSNPIVYQTAVMALLLVGMLGVRAADPGDVANLGAVVVLLVRAMSYSQRINSAAQQVQEVAPYVEEVQAREALYRSAPRSDATERLDRVEEMRLDSVTFGYEPEEPVLHEVSLEITRGEVIGLVGPSGSGKSTLVQILLRLRDPDAGRYLVNGIDAARFDRSSWARAVTFVPQENHILRGTVHDNIALFRDGVTAEHVAHAAVRAHLDADVRALPLGYETEIGSGAADLSGGQRQRLGLARALAGHPDVVVLDEPTSALDMRSEVLVQETLSQLKGDVTMIIVAHRLTTLAVCDRIIVLQDGRISAVGTYKQLQRRSRFFREAVELSRLPA